MVEGLGSCISNDGYSNQQIKRISWRRHCDMFFKPGDWVLYSNKPKSLQTLYCGWIGPFVIVEKVSPVDYLIPFVPDGKKKTVHSDELQIDPCDQDRPNWIKDELARHLAQASSNSVRPALPLLKVPSADQELSSVEVPAIADTTTPRGCYQKFIFCNLSPSTICPDTKILLCMGL